MNIYLYVKTHRKTGLKYLGMTTKLDPFKYTGSGKMWKQHLKEHGIDLDTEIIFKSSDRCKVKEKGIYYSNLWNVVKSDKWANKKRESGNGGWTPQSGKVPWNKGRPMSDEQKKKISETRKGRFTGIDNQFYGKHHTLKTKEYLSQQNRGRIIDPIVVAKRNLKQKGIPKPSVAMKLRGKPKSDEHKEKIRQALAKRYHSTKLHSPPGYNPS